ncbi:MAG: Stealth CR1 domain-containing protein [Opitutaceae bacterium]
MNASQGCAPALLLPRVATDSARRQATRAEGRRIRAASAARAASGPIDAVVTWVDGDDPAHRAKLRTHLAGLAAVPKIAHADRYRESGEFAFCIASLLRFAPWLRRIHIVTDAQEPAFWPALRDSAWRDRLALVDHTVLLAGHEGHLPTFNNRTLLSALWRIPGLAPRFVYLNDDFALLRPVAPEDFFHGEAPVLRGRWCWQPWRHAVAERARRWAATLGLAVGVGNTRPSYHQGQALAARRAGFRWRYFRAPHTPHPLSRALLAGHFARHPEHFEENIRHRLRSPEQFLADALANHLALAQGCAVIDRRLRTLRLKPAHCAAPRLERMLARADRDERTVFVCLQSIETLPAARRAVLLAWLARRIGRPEEVFRGAALATAAARC